MWPCLTPCPQGLSGSRTLAERRLFSNPFADAGVAIALTLCRQGCPSLATCVQVASLAKGVARSTSLQRLTLTDTGVTKAPKAMAEAVRASEAVEAGEFGDLC